MTQGRWLSVPPLVHLEGPGGRSLGGGGVEVGVPSPILIPSSSLDGSAPYSELFRVFHQGENSSWGGSVIIRQGGDRASSPLSGLLQPPVCCVEGYGFMEACNRSFAPQPLCLTYAVQDGNQHDWMFSINLKDAYLQVPVHPDSCRYLWFVEKGQVFQFRALCFGLPHSPSGFYQGHGSCIGYSSRHGCPDTSVSGRLVGPRLVQSRSPVGKGQGSLSLSSTGHSGELCQVSSGPLTFSHLTGDVPRDPLFEGFPVTGKRFNPAVSARRISVLQAARHRCLAQSPGSALLSLPSGSGGRLRMRSLQLELRRRLDFLDESVVLSWTPEIERDLEWWYDTDHLLQHPDLLFWSDALDQG